MRHFLAFERPIAELEGKIDELRRLSTDSGLDIAEEVGQLEAQVRNLLSQSYAALTPWQKVQVALARSRRVGGLGGRRGARAVRRARRGAHPARTGERRQGLSVHVWLHG